MLTEKDILELIVDMVPQWFIGTGHNHTTNVRLRGEEVSISMVRNATPELYRWKDECVGAAERFLSNQSLEFPKIAKEILQARFAIFWLRRKGYEAEWESLLDYCKQLEARTFENANIGFTLIVKAKTHSTEGYSLVDGSEQKLLDVLSDTQFTFFETNQAWKIVDYQYVPWEKIKSRGEYALSPELLHPYQSAMEGGDFGVKKTKRGDILVFNRSEILASYRKGKWHIYDSSNLKNTICEIVAFYGGQYRLGANLYEIILDLSYRRHGALLIILPRPSSRELRISDIVVNHSSFTKSEYSSPLRAAMLDRIRKINLGSVDYSTVHKPLLLELASLDGSVFIAYSGRIMSFGSMIKLSATISSEAATGARTTAALSAFDYECLPIKVSADGEISIFFKANGRQGLLSFL